VTVVQELRELLAQALVALALMAGDHRMLENLSLYILRKLGPDVRHGLTQNRDKAGIGIRREFGHVGPFLAQL
jgi:hypothetical protein